MNEISRLGPRSIRDKAKVLERAHLHLESELGRILKKKKLQKG